MSGTLLKAAEAAAGLHIQTKCEDGFWYDASIIRVDRGNGPTRIIAKYRGKWRGWKPKDLIVAAGVTSRRFRLPLTKSEVNDERGVHEYGAEKWALRLPDGSWPAERIIRKRRGKYLVRWQGFDSKDDSWEPPSTISDDLIAEYEEARCEKGKPPPAVRTPFTLERCKKKECEEVQAMRVEDARHEMLAWALEWVSELRRKSEPAADVRLAKHPRPVSPAAFVALRQVLLEYARECHPKDSDDELNKLRVLPLKSVKGGERPIDSITVYSDLVLNRVVNDAPVEVAVPGNSPMTLNYYVGNSAAVKLIAPFTFYCRGHCREDGTAWGSTDMVVKGHVATLLQDHGHPGGVRFRLDDESFAYKDADRAAYKRAMANAIQSKTVVQWPAEYLSDWWKA